jgi:Zn-dependent M28 family amino/carboxypeptidase
VVEIVELEGKVAGWVMRDHPVKEHRQRWVDTMNATLQLMQVSDLEDDLWAKAIVFRWIWDWELAHPEEAVLSCTYLSGDDRQDVQT